jgi:hypothetical protein
MSRLVTPWRAFAAVAGLLALQACAPQQQAAAPAGPRIYAVDLQGGARLCTVPAISLATDRPAETAIVVGNDGGWCGISVSQPGPKPFDAGLVTERPSNGRLNIHTVGSATRIDYTPDRGYAGPDAFAVRMVPGGGALKVAVTVQATEPVATSAAAPATQPAAATAPAQPARRSAPRR